MPSRPHTRICSTLTPMLLPLLLAACTRAPAPASLSVVERGPYGEWTDADGTHIPRAALAHLVGSAPIPFEPMDPGYRLHRDDTGLLGAMGLLRDDVFTVDDHEAELDSWFSASEVAVTIVRNGVSEVVSFQVDGAPVPPPVRKMTTLGRPGDPLPALDPTAPIPRGWLVHLVDTTAEPFRVEGEPAGYRLEGPFFEATGLSKVTRIDGVKLTTDEDLYDGLDTWFSAEETVLSTGGGEVTLRFRGAATAPPGAWTPKVVLSLEERRARAGVVLTPGAVSLPRTALADLAYATELLLPRPALPEGVNASRALGPDVASLLGLDAEAVLLPTHERPLSSEADMLELRRALLTEERVTLALPDATLLLEITGDSVPLPEGWPRGGPFKPPEPVRGIALGDPVVAQRLAVRRLLGRTRLVADAPPGLILAGTHPMFLAVDVNAGSKVLSLDGVEPTNQEDVDRWLESLCRVPEATIVSQPFLMEPEEATIRIEGPPVPCR